MIGSKPGGREWDLGRMGYHRMDEQRPAIQCGETLTFKEWLEMKVRQGFEPNTDAPLGSSDNPSSKILTWANAITVSRMLLTLGFLALFVMQVNRPLAICIYAIAACTDWMDGQIARRTQTVSWFGKILDPICDRFLLFTGVLGLVILGELPLWVAVFIIGRDVYLACGNTIVRRYRERPIDVVYVGKIATALLMFGFCDLLLGLPVVEGLGVSRVPWLPGLNSVGGPVGLFFVYAGCVFSFITACVYTAEGVAIIRACKRRNRKEGN